MRTYLLNSAVITSPGTYRYDLLSPESARDRYRAWCEAGVPPESTIGYEETAAALSLLLGDSVAVNRVMIRMETGDEALVFRLVLPPGSPRISPADKGRMQKLIEAGHYELGLLRREE